MGAGQGCELVGLWKLDIERRVSSAPVSTLQVGVCWEGYLIQNQFQYIPGQIEEVEGALGLWFSQGPRSVILNLVLLGN